MSDEVSPITKAIEEMADKLKAADKTNQLHKENIQTMVDKINSLEVELIRMQEERETWAEAAKSREKELDLYINRKIVGQEMINDYFGKIFEKELDKFLGHLHHSKKGKAELLLSLSDKERKAVTDKRKALENEIVAMISSYKREDELGIPS